MHIKKPSFLSFLPLLVLFLVSRCCASVQRFTVVLIAYHGSTIIEPALLIAYLYISGM